MDHFIIFYDQIDTHSVLFRLLKTLSFTADQIYGRRMTLLGHESYHMTHMRIFDRTTLEFWPKIIFAKMVIFIKLTIFEKMAAFNFETEVFFW